MKPETAVIVFEGALFLGLLVTAGIVSVLTWRSEWRKKHERSGRDDRRD